MTARVGLIIPSSNRMVEQEMVRHFPPGVQAHVMRLRMTGVHRVALDQLLPRVEEAARALSDARCEVVAFHCTANSMSDGLDGERRLLDAVMRAGAPQATTTASAIRKAFAALGVRRIVLLTPYNADTTEEEAHFLRTAGYEVVLAKGFALKGSDEYCATPAQFWRDRAIEAARPEADAYLISCANISTFAVIEEIEARLGRPVVTSNQTVIWQALSQLDWRDRRNCPGRLFATLSGETLSGAAAPDRAENVA
jgi:maleate isomerase